MWYLRQGALSGLSPAHLSNIAWGSNVPACFSGKKEKKHHIDAEMSV
jgi:hypothetical protein